MRDHHGLAAIILALLAAVLLAGTAHTPDFQQAAHAEAAGFAALAHDLSGSGERRADNRIEQKGNR